MITRDLSSNNIKNTFFTLRPASYRRIFFTIIIFYLRPEGKNRLLRKKAITDDSQPKFPNNRKRLDLGFCRLLPELQRHRQVCIRYNCNISVRTTITTIQYNKYNL